METRFQPIDTMDPTGGAFDYARARKEASMDNSEYRSAAERIVHRAGKRGEVAMVAACKIAIEDRRCTHIAGYTERCAVHAVARALGGTQSAPRGGDFDNNVPEGGGPLFDACLEAARSALERHDAERLGARCWRLAQAKKGSKRDYMLYQGDEQLRGKRGAIIYMSHEKARTKAAELNRAM